MKNLISNYSLLLILIALPLQLRAGESLSQYVAKCKNELGFTSIPYMSCEDGIAFAATGPAGSFNDYVGYKALNENVDLTFACRWVDRQRPIALTLELMIHNRRNGKTCFFSASERDIHIGSEIVPDSVPTRIVPPTSTIAGSYWRTPEEVDRDIQCVGCHVAGPYIASPAVVDELARFGLINDGHDTFVPTSASADKKYRAIGETFSHWGNIIESNIERNTCASSCHAIGYNSTEPTRTAAGGSNLLPSISSIISRIATVGSMPPNDPDSSYRWINRDSSLNGSGDHEKLELVEDLYDHLYCSSPKRLQARAVGSEFIIETGKLPDKLKTFNLRDGLVCVNSDQPSGLCNNYETRYLCDGEWTAWKSRDSHLTGTSDYESRELYQSQYGLCSSPTEIQARVRAYNSVGQLYTRASSYGPRDRLATFDKSKGLVCLNADQGSGEKCSNYSVRFICE